MVFDPFTISAGFAVSLAQFILALDSNLNAKIDKLLEGPLRRGYTFLKQAGNVAETDRSMYLRYLHDARRSFTEAASQLEGLDKVHACLALAFCLFHLGDMENEREALLEALEVPQRELSMTGAIEEGLPGTAPPVGLVIGGLFKLGNWAFQRRSEADRLYEENYKLRTLKNYIREYLDSGSEDVPPSLTLPKNID